MIKSKNVMLAAVIACSSLFAFNANAFGLGDIIGAAKEIAGANKGSTTNEPIVRPSDAQCMSMIPSGFPKTPYPDSIKLNICHQGYVLGYNTQTKTPIWVGEYLTRQNLDTKNATRNDNFRPDPMVLKVNPSSSATLQDYAGSSRVGSGYDRGHMAPAEDFRKFPEQMDESFYLSNMVPQNSNNNRGIWAALEKNVRYWAQKYEAAEVVTGPIYYKGQSQGRLGTVEIPTHLYKVIYLPKKGVAIGFILPNSPVEKSELPNYAMSVSNVEELSGMKFFPRIAQSIKDNKPNDLQVFDK